MIYYTVKGMYREIVSFLPPSCHHRPCYWPPPHRFKWPKKGVKRDIRNSATIR